MPENLRASIEAFLSPASRVQRDDPYKNRFGIWGRYRLLWSAENYHMLSISNCEISPRNESIARCLQGVRHISEDLEGFYNNRKGALGYYATFKSTCSFDQVDHWYMLARSNDYKSLFRLRDKPDLSEDMRDMINYLDNEQSERDA